MVEHLLSMGGYYEPRNSPRASFVIMLRHAHITNITMVLEPGTTKFVASSERETES